MAAKDCPYCYGHGLHAAWWDLGLRWVVPVGTFGMAHPEFAKAKRYACDRCGKPKDLQQPPKHNTR